MLLLRGRLRQKLSKQMLTVSMNLLVRDMVDDFTSDVNKRDVMSLSDVKDGVTGTVGESPHADVQAVIATFHVMDGELGKQVSAIQRC